LSNPFKWGTGQQRKVQNPDAMNELRQSGLKLKVRNNQWWNPVKLKDITSKAVKLMDIFDPRSFSEWIRFA
jgi:hypothetical protein